MSGDSPQRAKMFVERRHLDGMPARCGRSQVIFAGDEQEREMMSKLWPYIGKLSISRLAGLGFVFIGLVGILDYLSGSELSFSIFYMAPIAFLAWFVGRRIGILGSVVAAILWLLVDLRVHPLYSHPLIPYWNALVRFGFFLIVTYALSALKAARVRQEELTQFIVHDLRAPLANVITGLQILQEISSNTMDEAQKTLVDMGILASDRMLTLINSLLDLARLENGRMPLNPKQSDVKNVVESAIKQVSAWAARSHITLVSELAPHVETVYMDPDLTLRVLINLISNAIKFSQPNSAITVRVVPAEADSLLAFSVADQGRGIPKEWADKVFDKFVQVEARRAGSTVGSGLGLTFCRLAIEAQGGRISLESEVDKGTIITFTLPIVPT